MDFLWRIELFGGLRLVSGEPDAAVVERFQTRKTASLLAYLAFHRGRILPRDVLADQFWPDAPPDDARNSLRVALASLRRQLEPPGVPSGAVLVAGRNTVTLPTSAFMTDVAKWEEAVHAERRLEEADPASDAAAPTALVGGEERLSLLLRAVELYRGPLLSGSYDDWVASEQTRLAASFATVLRRLVRLLIARRDNDRAVVYARQIAALDPLDEDAHRTLIRLYMAQGRPGDARAQWRTLETVLRDELGIAPSDASRAMAEQFRLNAGPEAKDKGERIKDKKAKEDGPPAPNTGGTGGETEQGGNAPLGSPIIGGGGGHEDGTTSENSSFILPPSSFSSGGSLPVQFTRLWGREAELNALAPLLRPVSDADAAEAREAQGGDALFAAGDPRTRLVTLTGPGGTGKTRLAVELGARLRPSYENRVWFAPLASVTDPQLLGRALADVLRVPPPPPGATTSPLDAVVAALGGDADDGSPTLLILDNAEQIVASVARLVRILLARTPRLTCLVTSRQRLDLSGEYEFALDPLPLPRAGESVSAEALSRCASVQLFVDRAQALRPDFQITPRSATAIAELCRRLDGLPLALELAAAWARLLTPTQMLERLGEASDALLTSDRRGLSERHRSLRAVMDESYQLLSPPAQNAFAALSVFRGGWTARAAAAVMDDASYSSANSDQSDGASGIPRNDTNTLEWMRLLNQHSLVRMDEDKGSGDLRFFLLETVREYAATKLTGEERCARADAHARFFIHLARLGETGLVGPEADDCLAELDREQDNLRAALAWTLRPPGAGEGEESARCASDAQMGLRLAASLWRFWYVRGQGDEGSPWLMRALHAVPAPEGDVSGDNRERAETLALRGEALLGAGRLAARQGDVLEACGLLEEALQAFQTLGEDAKIIVAATNLASAARDRGDARLAHSALATALAATRRAAPYDLWTLAALLTEAGQAALAVGDAKALAVAQTLLREDADLRDQLCDRWGAAEARLLLAQTLEKSESGDGKKAEKAAARTEAELLRTSGEAVMNALGDDHSIAASFLRLGYIAQAQGDFPAARGLFADSLSAFQAAAFTDPNPAEAGPGATSIVDGMVLAWTAIGMTAWRQNDTGAARDAFAFALDLRRDERDSDSGGDDYTPLALTLLPVAFLAASSPATRPAARSALRECLELRRSTNAAPSDDFVTLLALRLQETLA